MPRAKSKVTVGDVLDKVQELKRRSSVQKAIVSILRSRYLPRDGVPEPQAQISCEGAPVPFGVIEEMVYELEEGCEEMDKVVNTYLKEELS